MVKAYDAGDDDEPKKGPGGSHLKDFDCPSCNANNPSDERIGTSGVEIRCNYCGTEFKVTVTDEGKFKFREI